jgi:hypothetical protein
MRFNHCCEHRKSNVVVFFNLKSWGKTRKNRGYPNPEKTKLRKQNFK